MCASTTPSLAPGVPKLLCSYPRCTTTVVRSLAATQQCDCARKRCLYPLMDRNRHSTCDATCGVDHCVSQLSTARSSNSWNPSVGFVHASSRRGSSLFFTRTTSCADGHVSVRAVIAAAGAIVYGGNFRLIASALIPQLVAHVEIFVPCGSRRQSSIG